MVALLVRLIAVTLGVVLTITPAEPYALWKRFGPTTTVTPQTPKSLTIPAISSSNGTVSGAVLTATTGTWGNCSACNYAYVWVATADPVNGPWISVGDSTGSYTTPLDSTLSYAVSVIATNAVGTATSGSSLIWGPMVPLAPAPTASPTISSNNGVTAGATLTSTTGGWNNCSSCSYAYQWASASASTGPWTNVGTNSASYTTPIGSTLYYSSTVTATNTGGSVPSAQSAAFGPMTGSSSPPVNTAAPTISSGNGTNAGTATLVSTTGTWSNCSTCTYTYQWYQGATSTTASMAAISGAITNTYQTQFSDATKYISVVAVATGNGSSVTSPRATAFGPLTSGSAPSAPPVLVSAPTISPLPTTIRQGPGNSYGVPTGTWVGNTITANNGTWSNCPCTFTYQWYKDGVLLTGATNQTLAIQSGTANAATPPTGWQNGAAILAYITATNALGSAVEATEVEPIVQTGDWSVATPPTLVKCTDASFACTTTAAIGPGTNLAAGDYIKIIDGTISGGSFVTGFDYSWQRDPSGQSPPVGIEAWKSVGNSAPVSASWLAGVATYTMTGPTVSNIYIWPGGIVSISGFTPSSNQYNGVLSNVLGTTVSGGQVSSFTVGKGTDPGGNMTGGSVSFPHSNVRLLEAGSMTLGGDQDGNQKGIQNFSVSTPVGTGRTTMQTMPVGPIVAPGGTLSPPANVAIPTIASFPANGTGKVGFILFSGTPNVPLPGSWNNIPWNFTYQWFYCNSACSNPAPGQLLSGTLIPGATQGPKYYPLSDRDIGHQVFFRVSAYNSAGTTLQDSAPTAVISLPDVPTPPSSPPVIVGPAVYGSADGGLTNYGGTVMVNGYGTWGGYPTKYTYQFYSCPTSTPSCTTPATGTSYTYNDGLGWFPTYNIVAADLGNTISMDVIGSNAAAPQGVHARSNPTAVVSTFTPSPPLPAGKLGVYPAGQDPLTPGGCTPIPAMPYSGGRDWYVDNGPAGSTPTVAMGGGSYSGGVAGTADGTSAHPFNSLKAMFAGGNSFQQPGYGYPLISTVTYNHGAPGSWTGARPTTDPIASDWVPTNPSPKRINPGDRIIVKQGTGSYGVLNLFGSISNVNYPESNVDASGNTKFIQVAPDTGALPVVDRVSFGGRGWIVNGLRIGNTTTPGTAYVALNGTDTIVTNSTIGAYDSLSSALADYNAKCITTSCSSANFNSFLISAMASAGTLNGHCNALTNNKIWFTAGGPSVTYPQTNGLLEGNDLAYVNNDFEDLTSAGPAIWHMEYMHDPIIPTVHPDMFQTQPVSNSAFYPGTGLVFDSNRAITSVDTNLLAVNDPKYCASISKPSNCTDLILTGDLQCFQGSGAPHTGIRYVNNLCYATGHAGIPGDINTIVNNTMIGGGFQTPQPLETKYMHASYVANNVANGISCGPNNTYKNNFVVPSGSTNGIASNCGAGVTANPTGGGSAFISYTPVVPVGTTALVYPWTTSNDLRPSSAAPAILLGTGLAGTNAPTTTAERPETCSTFQGNCAAQGTRATPPNVGIY